MAAISSSDTIRSDSTPLYVYADSSDSASPATPVETFFGLTAMVRKEFSFVDDKAWAEGRIAFWRGFLQRKNGRVFRTSHFEHLNNVAISNIEKEVFSLERGMFL